LVTNQAAPLLVVQATVKAPRPVMVLRVEATTKVAGLLDRAAMVLNQTSAPQGTPPPTHSKATRNQEVTNKLASHKASSKEVIRVVVATDTNL